MHHHLPEPPSAIGMPLHRRARPSAVDRRHQRLAAPTAVGFPLALVLSLFLAWGSLPAQGGFPKLGMDTGPDPAPATDVLSTGAGEGVASFSPEPFPPAPDGTSARELGKSGSPETGATTLYAEPGRGTVAGGSDAGAAGNAGGSGNGTGSGGTGAGPAGTVGPSGTAPVTPDAAGPSASEAARLQEQAAAAAHARLEESIRAMQQRLQDGANEDLHLSPDGRTLVWQVRSAAKASDLSATAREVLGAKVKAVKGFESFNSLLLEMAEPSVENLESILEFIGQVDNPQKQVFIKVLIAEMQVLDSQSWGGQLELLKAAVAGTDWSGTAGVNHGLSTTPAEAAAKAGFKLFLISGQVFKKFLYAQQGNSTFKVLSHPQIVATHGKQARVVVGQEVNVRKNTSYRDGVVTIEYGKVPVGLSLTVTPYLQSNGVVSMDIMQTLSSLDSYDETLNLANTTNRLLQTSATARLGQTVVLAGIIQKRKQRSRAGVPVLSRIPGVGKLFDRSDWGEQRIELLVFLTPEPVHAGERLPVASAVRGPSVSADLRNLREVRSALEGHPSTPATRSKPKAPAIPPVPAPASAPASAPARFPAAATAPAPLPASAAVRAPTRVMAGHPAAPSGLTPASATIPARRTGAPSRPVPAQARVPSRKAGKATAKRVQPGASSAPTASARVPPPVPVTPRAAKTRRQRVLEAFRRLDPPAPAGKPPASTGKPPVTG